MDKDRIAGGVKKAAPTRRKAACNRRSARPRTRCARSSAADRTPSEDNPLNLEETRRATMRLLILILLIVLLLGALPTWPYSAGWGYYPSGGLGLLVVILIVVLLIG